MQTDSRWEDSYSWSAHLFYCMRGVSLSMTFLTWKSTGPKDRKDPYRPDRYPNHEPLVMLRCYSVLASFWRLGTTDSAEYWRCRLRCCLWHTTNGASTTDLAVL